jgi:flavin-binding protein dodecin
MSIVKVTEVITSSTESFDDALKNGIKRASKTLKGITGAWVADQKVIVKDGEISEYRVVLKISFVLED